MTLGGEDICLNCGEDQFPRGCGCRKQSEAQKRDEAVTFESLLSVSESLKNERKKYLSSFAGMDVFLDRSLPPNTIRVHVGEKAYRDIFLACQEKEQKR